ncbi:hypothetical protein D3C72_944640 [compost metagenome]
MDDDLRPECAEQVQPLEQQEQRNEEGEAGRHAGDHDDDSRLFRLQPGDAVTGRHADHQRQNSGRTGDEHRIPEIEEEIILLEHLHIVRPCETLGDEDRWIGAVVDFIFQRQRDHPDEEQDNRRNHHKRHEKQADAVEVFTFEQLASHQRSSISFHCARWRTIKSTKDSATMMMKKTTAMAEP